MPQHTRIPAAPPRAVTGVTLPEPRGIARDALAFILAHADVRPRPAADILWLAGHRWPDLPEVAADALRAAELRGLVEYRKIGRQGPPVLGLTLRGRSERRRLSAGRSALRAAS